MSEIVFSRVDHRLIHGQVMTKWLKIAKANKIIIIDDYLSTESFMLDVYRLSAPSDIEIDIISPKSINEFYEKEENKNSKFFLLFKDLNNVEEAFKNGLKFNFLQLGGIPKDNTRKNIFNAVCLNESEIEILKKLNENDVKIEAQIIPEEGKMSFDEILNKFENN